MALNGLLLLTSSTLSLASRSRLTLSGAKRLLDLTDRRVAVATPIPPPVLYVVPFPAESVASDQGQQLAPRTSPPLFSSSVASLSALVYSQGNAQIPSVDIRFLLNSGRGLLGHPSAPIDLVLVEGCQGKVSLASVRAFVQAWFHVSRDDVPVQFLEKEEEALLEPEEAGQGGQNEGQGDPVLKQYDVVALGGTFDRMHNAHKILLTEAVLRCRKELIVGVTSDKMITSKLLYEFIEQCPVRLERVRSFLRDVAPHLSHRVVEIDDPFGPTIRDKDIGLIVVSAETIKGADKINEIRKEKGFPVLDVHHIILFSDALKESEYEEDKISSSSQRIRILGDRLAPPRKTPSVPYIIGLTGGICSGKSTLCKYLETLGLPTINCDLLGHQAYNKGTKCFDQIVATFGQDVLSQSGDEINRKVLGTKVFNNPQELKKLTDIVWPEIKRLAQEHIDKLAAEGHKAIVLDAAVLLEAGWDDMCNDVWVVVIPKEETIKRVQKRDGLSAEDAEKRVAAQVSNHERVDRANFVFCSLWEVDFTRRQADKAWRDIKAIIQTL